MRIDDFFDYANRREVIRLRKEAGAPRDEWTDDPVLKEWSFCNIEREHDRTTKWFCQHVRHNGPEEQYILRAVAFRWFNRVETGRAIAGMDPADRQVAQNLFVPVQTDRMLERLRNLKLSPVVTGAYVIKTPNGVDKLHGVIECINRFKIQRSIYDGLWANHYSLSQRLLEEPGQHSLEGVWNWLRETPYLGDFMSYEIVTDLANSPLLDKAPDIMTWANPGPGATNGLSYMLYGEPGHLKRHNRHDRDLMMELMQQILDASRHRRNWPHQLVWNMRTVEHTLCEFMKYERVKAGGRLKRRYR